MGKEVKKPVLFLMVDIETWGTAVNSAVRQICAIPFTLTDGIQVFGDLAFNEFANTYLQKDRHVDRSTVAFWNKPENKEINDMINYQCMQGHGPIKMAELWCKYITKLQKDWSLRYVGRGATTFDIPIISDFCKQYYAKFSPAFYTIYDLRSFVSICSAIVGADLKKNTLQGNHDAYTDCLAQILQINECVRALSSIKGYTITETGNLFTQSLKIGSK